MIPSVLHRPYRLPAISDGFAPSLFVRTPFTVAAKLSAFVALDNYLLFFADDGHGLNFRVAAASRGLE
jgi:hypothetical protein